MITNPLLPTQSTTAENPGVAMLQKLIPYAIKWGFAIGVIVFFFMLLIGGIKWISSGGDKDRLGNAKQTVSNALVGLVVLFCVFIIINLIDTIFGTTILQGISLPALT